MASLITSIIGGVQSASAAGKASAAQQAGANQAASDVKAAVTGVNPLITQAATDAGQKVTFASATAGQQGIDAAAAAATAAKEAAAKAALGVNTGVTEANKLLTPFTQNGVAASNQLSTAIAPGGTLAQPFSYEMDPGAVARLAESQKVIDRALIARGSGQGGAAVKSAIRNAQTFASNEVGAAFSRFDSNRKFTADTLGSIANRGLTAGTTEGSNLIGGAKYGGDTDIDATKYGGTTTLGAVTHAGDLNTRASEFGATADLNAVNKTTDNTLNATNFGANATMAAADAKAQGFLGKANAWNGMLSGIGKVGDALITGGMGTGGGGWSMSNLFKLPAAPSIGKPLNV